MVTLLAYAPEERWTFVRDGDRIVLMRPPFQEDITASDAEVERAVTVHGWIALERDFATRQELVDFIGNESVRVWSDRPTRSIESLRDALLARLTVADLDQQIERARRKIDDGRSDEVRVVLGRLLTAAALTSGQRSEIVAMQRQVDGADAKEEIT